MKYYLEKVNRLINRLKLGELSRGEVKGLKSNNILKKQLELRDDQVRVIFYPLTDNNYIIVGVLTKKKDNDNDGYSKMAFRNKEIDIPNNISLLTINDLLSNMNKYIAKDTQLVYYTNVNDELEEDEIICQVLIAEDKKQYKGV